MMRRACGLLLLCLLLASCAAKPLAPPQGAAAGWLRFVAWGLTDQLEVPLQGVVRLDKDAVSGWRAERMGLLLAQGPTVGVCQWSVDGVRREASDMPGAGRLLSAVERVVVLLARQRGIGFPGEDGPATVRPPDCEIVANDDIGPLELRCGAPPDIRITVRVTGDQR